MGYSDFGNFKLEDGYAIVTAIGLTYYSPFVDIHSAPFFDVSVVFTGGSPAGTLTLQKSNDLQWTGGNLVSPLSQGGVGSVSDYFNAPTGQGTVSATVSGAGTYSLNQYMVGYRWFRIAFDPSNVATTKLDIFVNWKK
jgi:hypothetical protein